MRVLYLTKYSRNAGSSRLRSFQYFPFFEKEGIQIEVSPLFSEKYLENLYANKSTFRESVLGYAKRTLRMFGLRKFDRIVIEKELFPYLPAFAERVLSIFGIPYIVDYDDAIFHNYDLSKNILIKSILGKKIDYVMRNAEVVISGNSYLAKRARDAGSKEVIIIPTAVNLERYFLKEKNKKKFVIGWIGTKTTFEKHLLPQKKWIKAIQEEDPAIHFHIVGITEDMDLGKNVKYIPWTENSEVSEIQKFDVGIMPLQDSLWEKGKCSYKIIQYYACGIPAIASPIGMNTEVVIPQHNGFLACTENEWLAAIYELKNDKEKSKILGINGRQMIESQYSLQVTMEKWMNAFNKVNASNKKEL